MSFHPLSFFPEDRGTTLPPHHRTSPGTRLFVQRVFNLLAGQDAGEKGRPVPPWPCARVLEEVLGLTPPLALLDGPAGVSVQQNHPEHQGHYVDPHISKRVQGCLVYVGFPSLRFFSMPPMAPLHHPHPVLPAQYRGQGRCVSLAPCLSARRKNGARGKTQTEEKEATRCFLASSLSLPYGPSSRTSPQSSLSLRRDLGPSLLLTVHTWWSALFLWPLPCPQAPWEACRLLEHDPLPRRRDARLLAQPTHPITGLHALSQLLGHQARRVDRRGR